MGILSGSWNDGPSDLERYEAKVIEHFKDPSDGVVPNAYKECPTVPGVKPTVSEETATIALELLNVLTDVYIYGRLGDAWSEDLSAQARSVILKGNEVRRKEKWEEKS